MNYLDRFLFWRMQGMGVIESLSLASKVESSLFYEFYSFNKARSTHYAQN